MFEKEADEYALEESTACNYGESSKHVYQGYFYGFQKGAEFGYNKAKEWHILAEEPDVLPKEGQKVKVLTEDNMIQESTYFYDDYFEVMAFSNVGLVKVLAWKEIVLPKEIKEKEQLEKDFEGMLYSRSKRTL